jgi:polysaccharide export outer membrane protein
MTLVPFRAPWLTHTAGCVLVMVASTVPICAQTSQQPGAARPQPAPPGKPAPQRPPSKPASAAKPPITAPSAPLPPDYVIGADDVLAVLFWRDKDMSVEQVVVRPDGMITLPLLNDLKAAGLTPDQFREDVMKAAAQYVEDPNVSIVVKQINSRKVYVTGQVSKAGSFPLTSPTTVMQALAMAGGLTEFANEEDIVVMRTAGGKTQTFKFNYKDVIRGKKLEQNIELKPGDTVVVP